VRDTATATFEGEGLPLDRLTEIVEALDAARRSIRPRQATKVGRNAPCRPLRSIGTKSHDKAFR
jgi:hypothetical protein